MMISHSFLYVYQRVVRTSPSRVSPTTLRLGLENVRLYEANGLDSHLASGLAGAAKIEEVLFFSVLSMGVSGS